MDLLLRILDLIVTLWNVNATVKVVVSDKSVDLIVTLWNVNSKVYSPSSTGSLRFNSYIMECKY